MAQMLTLTFAGHETTANTMSWMFWELAKHPEYQARMRDEIRAVRAAMIARGDDRFTIDDLDSMTTVMNAIKVHSLPCDDFSYQRGASCVGNPPSSPNRIQSATRSNHGRHNPTF